MVAEQRVIYASLYMYGVRMLLMYTLDTKMRKNSFVY